MLLFCCLQEQENIFIGAKTDQSNSDDDKNISELMLEFDEKENKTEESATANNGKPKKSVKSKPESTRTKNPIEIKGFVIDEQNQYHCLDCGKVFKLRSSYIQHKRL